MFFIQTLVSVVRILLTQKVEHKRAGCNSSWKVVRAQVCFIGRHTSASAGALVGDHNAGIRNDVLATINPAFDGGGGLGSERGGGG